MHAVRQQPIAETSTTRVRDSASASARSCSHSIRSFGSCAVAFSGGVDSAVVAKAAQLALGDRAVAVTGDSASLAEGELERRANWPELIGIRHEVIETDEFASPTTRATRPTAVITARANSTRSSTAAPSAGRGRRRQRGECRRSGRLSARHDGRRRASRCAVRWPSAASRRPTCARWPAHWELPVWDKPASPCLSSRIAYGEEVTPERLAMIDAASSICARSGLRKCASATIAATWPGLEVPPAQIERLCACRNSRATCQTLSRTWFQVHHD